MRGNVTVKICLHIRSSSEWKVITETLPRRKTSYGLMKRILESAKLIVYRDAKRLKASLRRVAARSSSRGRYPFLIISTSSPVV